jgi:hypothetical protein
MSSQISSAPSRTNTTSPAGQAFPTYYRREKGALANLDTDVAELSGSGDNINNEYLRRRGQGQNDAASVNEKDRVYYAPIPETQKLGYLSTAALIINKMVGTGIFSKPSSVLRSTGSKGGAMFLWVTGGVMTLTG